jgi:hypothetical protein
MSRGEKAFVIFYFVYVLAYIPFFFLLPSAYFFVLLLPLHLFCMAIGIPLLIIVFRDLYKRSFPNPNSKVTWAILLLALPIPSIPIYLYKYGFRPR